MNSTNYFDSFINNINNNKTQIISLTLLILYIILFYIFSFSSKFKIISDKYNYYTNILFLFVGMIWLFSIIVSYSSEQPISEIFFNNFKNIIIVILSFVIFFGAIYLISSSEIFNNFLSYIINFFIIGIAFYLAFRFITSLDFFKNFKNSPTYDTIINSYFFQIILLIPNFISNLFKVINSDIKHTPLYIYIILAIELGLIGLNFALPYLTSILYTHNSTQLLKEPIYTDKSTTIGTFENLHKQTSQYTENPNLQYNYCISSWIFLDNIGENYNESANEYTNILSYGSNPSILFNAAKSDLRIVMKQGLDGYEIVYHTNKIPLQKWNNIVINYSNGITDIFINGKLVGSKNQVLSYLTMDSVIVGQDDGFPGGICNVMYYKYPLSQTKIKMLYNLLKNKTPPYL